MSTPNLTIEGKILDTNGPVFAERNGERIELQINDPIYESDIIITDEITTTDILYRDGTKSRVAPNTRFTLTDYEFGENDDAPSFVMDLAHGAVRTATGEIVKLNPEAFEVITPRATVGIRGTEFLNEVDGTNETHAVLYISGGSVMVITDSQGNSITFDAPLQVTRFSNATGTFDGVSSITLGQMESVLSAISPTIAADIPQNSNQQGEWNKVEQIQVEQENENQNEDDQDDDADNSDDAQQDADEAAEDALNNPPSDFQQGQAQTVVIVASEGEEISDLVQKQLEDAGFNVVIVAPEDANDNLNSLIANSNNEIIKPEFNTDTAAEALSFNIGNYQGGNLTASNGLIFTPNELANYEGDVTLQGFQIFHYIAFPEGFPEPTPVLTTGSGNDKIVLGATYSNGTYTDLDSNPYEPINDNGGSQTHASVGYATISTGSGDDTIYIHHSYTDPDPDPYLPPAANSPLDAVYYSEINMGDGNDTFILKGQLSRSTVNMGEGNNTVILENATFSESASDLPVITAGSGNDSVNVNSDNSLNNLHISLGAGNDTANYDDAGTSNIDMGSGNDTLQIGKANEVNINMGSGDDTANIGTINSSLAEINLGAGNDIFLYTGSATLPTDNITGGDGIDMYIAANFFNNDEGLEVALRCMDTNLLPSLDSREDIANIAGVKVTGNVIYVNTAHWDQSKFFAGDPVQHENINLHLSIDGSMQSNVQFVDSTIFNTVA